MHKQQKKYIESYNQIDELHYKNFYVKEPIFCEMINENEYKAYNGKREFIVSKKEKKELLELMLFHQLKQILISTHINQKFLFQELILI